jgi:hypothetical protein
MLETGSIPGEVCGSFDLFEERARRIELRSQAQTYVSYGWKLLPLAETGKQPDGGLLDGLWGDSRTSSLRVAPASAREVDLWFEIAPEINLGVFPSESLWLIDIDRLAVLDPVIETPTASSGRENGGKHLYLSCGRLLPTQKMLWGHVNPSHLVLPGSRHTTGRVYEWLEGLSPEEVPLVHYREACPLLGLEIDD